MVGGIQSHLLRTENVELSVVVCGTIDYAGGHGCRFVGRDGAAVIIGKSRTALPSYIAFITNRSYEEILGTSTIEVNAAFVDGAAFCERLHRCVVHIRIPKCLCEFVVLSGIHFGSVALVARVARIDLVEADVLSHAHMDHLVELFHFDVDGGIELVGSDLARHRDGHFAQHGAHPFVFVHIGVVAGFDLDALVGGEHLVAVLLLHLHVAQGDVAHGHFIVVAAENEVRKLEGDGAVGLVCHVDDGSGGVAGHIVDGDEELRFVLHGGGSAFRIQRAHPLARGHALEHPAQLVGGEGEFGGKPLHGIGIRCLNVGAARCMVGREHDA